jgi:hypothetical protein
LLKQLLALSWLFFFLLIQLPSSDWLHHFSGDELGAFLIPEEETVVLTALVVMTEPFWYALLSP